MSCKFPDIHFCYLFLACDDVTHSEEVQVRLLKQMIQGR